MSGETSAPEHDLISAGRVQGSAVYAPGGERLGEIEDVMLHKRSGRVAYAVLSFGGFLGVGEKRHPLPWSLLKYDPDLGGYAVPLAKETLETAPAFARDELYREHDAWSDQVHTFYQVTPAWL